MLSGYLEDEFYTNYLKHPQIVYSRKTALYLNNLSNTQIDKFDVNVIYNYPSKKNDIIVQHKVSGNMYFLGLKETETPFGNYVMSYDKERNVCDMFIFDECDSEEKAFVIKEYIRSKPDYDKLYRYAERLGVYKEISTLFEIVNNEY